MWPCCWGWPDISFSSLPGQPDWKSASGNWNSLEMSMTDSRIIFGRRAVILAVFIAIAMMFGTSFVYRLNNPNLFVKSKQAPPKMGEQAEGGMPGAMGNGAMSRIREYIDRVKKDPNDVEALVGMGNSFLMMQAWDRALESLEKARKLKPEDTTILKAVGIAHFNKKEFAKATEAYKAILKIDPKDTLALFNLGVIAKHYSKDEALARTYFEQVLALEKRDMEMLQLAKEELGK